MAKETQVSCLSWLLCGGLKEALGGSSLSVNLLIISTHYCVASDFDVAKFSTGLSFFYGVGGLTSGLIA